MNGIALRDGGISLVDRNTARGWKDEADSVIRGLARAGHPFTAEDVRKWLPDPPKPNAMGARFMNAVRKKWIVKIGYTNASRKEAHARALALYKGLKP
jgi:hypothetical protein